MTAVATDRIRKSERLTTDEFKALVKWVRAQPTKVDAAILLDITRPTLDRILIVRSASLETINKVRKVLREIGTAS